MIKNTELTEQDKILMDQYNIKTETRTVFHSDGYKYDNLKDALKYAKQSLEKKQAHGNE